MAKSSRGSPRTGSRAVARRVPQPVSQRLLRRTNVIPYPSIPAESMSKIMLRRDQIAGQKKVVEASGLSRKEFVRRRATGIKPLSEQVAGIEKQYPFLAGKKYRGIWAAVVKHAAANPGALQEFPIFLNKLGRNNHAITVSLFKSNEVAVPRFIEFLSHVKGVVAGAFVNRVGSGVVAGAFVERVGSGVVAGAFVERVGGGVAGAFVERVGSGGVAGDFVNRVGSGGVAGAFVNRVGSSVAGDFVERVGGARAAELIYENFENAVKLARK